MSTSNEQWFISQMGELRKVYGEFIVDVSYITFAWEVWCNYFNWTGSILYVWSTGPVYQKTSLSMLRTLYQDFKVSTDVPWLHWPMQVDTFCLSLFKCGIRGFDFWYLWMSLFGTGGLSNVFSIQVLCVVLRIKMKRFKMEVCRTWNKIPGVVAKNNNQIERSYGSFQLLPPES